MASFKPTKVQVYPKLGEKVTQDTLYWKNYKVRFFLCLLMLGYLEPGVLHLYLSLINVFSFFCMFISSQPPLQIKEFGAITNIDFSPVAPHNFAVTAFSRVCWILLWIHNDVVFHCPFHQALKCPFIPHFFSPFRSTFTVHSPRSLWRHLHGSETQRIVAGSGQMVNCWSPDVKTKWSVCLMLVARRPSGRSEVTQSKRLPPQSGNVVAALSWCSWHFTVFPLAFFSKASTQVIWKPEIYG